MARREGRGGGGRELSTYVLGIFPCVSGAGSGEGEGGVIVCGRLSPWISIIFSLLSNAPKFSMLHSSILLVSSSNTFRFSGQCWF